MIGTDLPVPAMRRLVLVATIVAGLAAGVPLRAADNLVLARFGDYLESLRVQTGIPGLAAVIVGSNDIAWERPFGQTDVDRNVFTRPDTPFHLDGLTQTVTAALVLRCVDEGRFSLDDRLERFAPGSPEAGATIRQVLTHTSSDGNVFSYRPQRADALTAVVESCNGVPLRGAFSKLFSRFVMWDSVPGADVVALASSPDGISQSDITRYPSVLERLTVPYAVDARGRPSKSQFPATTLTASTGMISTARDYARFDLALRTSSIVSGSLLAQAWTAPVGRDGRTLPHGMGWFVQNYNGEKIVWQFGQGDNASSSLVVIVPARSLTLVLLANSDGLSKSLGLSGGDLTNSPFGKLFLGLFVR
jgi:CubicO group peptidase (beta-lactamase class C family)